MRFVELSGAPPRNRPWRYNVIFAPISARMTPPVPDPIPEPTPDSSPSPSAIVIPEGPGELTRRRADVDAKQAKVGRILAETGCEGAILFVPPFVAWFTGGMNVRGLIAETERPGIYTNGRQRWLLCSNIDTQRLFDEELDGLGFQLKEWQYAGGRGNLLGDLVGPRKIAFDRPFFQNMPLIADRLRGECRALAPFDRDRYFSLGKVLVRALEATARNFVRGETEDEVAGHLAHRLLHKGSEVVSVSVTADGRGRKFRRTGFTAAQISNWCTIQATATRDGLYVSASRTVWFGKPDERSRTEYDLATKLMAVYRSMTKADAAVGPISEAARRLLAGTEYEYEWRLSQPGYGTGWFPAEELRRHGQDDPFVTGQPIVWQSRVGAAAIVDTVISTDLASDPVTPPDAWPFKRVRFGETNIDIPDIFVRDS